MRRRRVGDDRGRRRWSTSPARGLRRGWRRVTLSLGARRQRRRGHLDAAGAVGRRPRRRVDADPSPARRMAGALAPAADARRGREDQRGGAVRREAARCRSATRWVVGAKGSATEAPVESDSAARRAPSSKASNNGPAGGGEESRAARRGPPRTVVRECSAEGDAGGGGEGRGVMEGIIGWPIAIAQWEYARRSISVRDEMDLRQLRYLDAVASARSFTAAALDLHVAQSALSQQVAKLERELGVELLKRTTRRVEVTEAGQVVLERGRRAMAEADAIREDLDALRGLVRGSLRIGGVPPVSGLHPAKLIAEFGARSIRASTSRSARTSPRVLLERAGQGRASTWCSRSIDPADTRRPALTGPPADRRGAGPDPRARPPARPAQARSPTPRCSGERLVAYGEGSRAARRAGATRRTTPGHRRGQRAGTLQELVALGLGVTLMPSAVVASTPPTTLAVRPLHPRDPRARSACSGAPTSDPTPAAARVPRPRHRRRRQVALDRAPSACG